jgi:hypothetical protein
MADLRISELATLAGANLAAGDFLPIADTSASETKKITVTDLVGNATTLIADGTIPGAKIVFGSGTIPASALAGSSITASQLANDAVTAAKLADESSVDLVTTLPGSGAFVGQIALDTDDSKIYCWNGSTWVSVKGAGSVNAVLGSTAGVINIVATTVGDEVTISATLDNTTAAAEFLAGPTASAGTVGYRPIVGADLPTATTTTKGAVVVNGNGLTLSGDTITINNTVTAEASNFHIVQYNAKGLVTSGRVISASDVPIATASTNGIVKPGSGLGVNGSGTVNHTNAIGAGSGVKLSFDTEGHITGAASLVEADIPNLSAAKIATGTLDIDRIGANAVTGVKLANFAITKIGSAIPSADSIGQFFFNPLSRDLLLWDGNVYQPVGITAGEIVFSGTYNASTNRLDSVTAEGAAAGFVNGSTLPSPAGTNSGYYVVISQTGTGTAPAPTVTLEPPDILLSNGTSYTLIETSQTLTAQTAINVAFTPAGTLSSSNVQSAIEEVATESLQLTGGTISGQLLIGSAGSFVFEGATNNAFETTLAVVDPTADRTITLPDSTGTLVTTGDTGSVTSTMILDGTILNADVNASAAIAGTKISPDFGSQNVVTTGTATAAALIPTGSSVPTNGVYLSSANNVSIATNSTERLLIDATGQIEAVSLGTAAAPTYSFTTDPNTGIYSPGADQVAISTSGSERIRIGANGEIGIGGANYGTSGQILTSGGSGAAPSWTTLTVNTDKIEEGNSSAEVIDTGSDGRFVVTTEGTERARIDSSGRLLVGTSSSRVAGNQARTVQIEAAAETGQSIVVNSANQFDAPAFVFGRSRGTSLGSNTVVQSGDVLAYLQFCGADGTDLETRAAEITCVVDGTPGSNDMPGRLVFATTADGASSPTERLRIDSSGRVGIGTASPGSPLTIESNAGNQVKITYPSVASYFLNATSGGDFAINKDGTERARIDTSGRLLVGTSTVRNAGNASQSSRSPLYFIEGAGANAYSLFTGILGRADVNGPNFTFAKTRSNTLGDNTIVQNGDVLGQFFFAGADGTDLNSIGASIQAEVDGTPGVDDMPGRLVFSTTADGASSPTERMRIDSAGRTGFGVSPNSYGDNGLITLNGTNYTRCIFSNINGTSSATHVTFGNGNGAVGSITTSGSATAYNTSSDYRLKENVVPLTGAADRVTQIPVHRFNFIADPDKTVDGFLAHEAQAVVPECVTGTKDEVDSDGNPVYQGIDQSKLVPLLTAALQEALAEIESLKARVSALEP